MSQAAKVFNLALFCWFKLDEENILKVMRNTPLAKEKRKDSKRGQVEIPRKRGAFVYIPREGTISTGVVIDRFGFISVLEPEYVHHSADILDETFPEHEGSYCLDIIWQLFIRFSTTAVFQSYV